MSVDSAKLKVASYQGVHFEKCPEKNLQKTRQVIEQASKDNVDILCMPESYLHGYFADASLAKKYSIDLESNEFADLCHQFSGYSTTLIIGINERDGEKIFNTSVVIEAGKFVGKYRKAYTYPPYDYFSLGREFPVFEKRGVKYGIIICLDSTFREPAFITALKGARILFCPMFNRVSRDEKLLQLLSRKSHFITRAFDNNCWFLSSDVVWNSDDQVCQGYATIVNSDGLVVAQSQPFAETLLTYSIPLTELQAEPKKRLRGNAELFDVVNEIYHQCT